MSETRTNKRDLTKKQLMSYKLSCNSVTQETQKRKCEYCKKSFNATSNLFVHIRTHTGEKPYQCKSCSKKFSENSNLFVHTRTHTGEKPYKCKYCKSSFAKFTTVMVHTRTHTGEKPYACTSCPKKFSHKSSLVVHTRNHTGEKPFKCEYCKRSFAKSSSLKVHTRTHTGEKPYACKSCSGKFSQQSSLVVHARTHTKEKPYRCEYCKRSFALSSTLNEHTRTHTGEKPYKCRFCGYSATTSKTFVVHERIHSEKKPYKCQFCRFSTKYKTGLKHHAKRHCGGGLDGGARVFECSTCPKVYPSPKQLIYQANTHMGGKTFMCTLLDSSSIKENAVVSHKVRKPNVTENNVFQREISHLINKIPLRPFAQKIRIVQEQTSNIAANQLLLYNRSSPHLCRACGFSATTDADLALHMSALHKLPVVELGRLRVICT